MICELILKHKKKCMGAAITVPVLILAYKGIKAAQAHTVPLADQLLLSLTDAQRVALAKLPADSRTLLLEKLDEFPLDVEADEQLVALFDDNQKRLLALLVEEYHRNNPHVSMMHHFHSHAL